MARFVLLSLLGHLLVAALFWIPWDFLRPRTITPQPVIPLELVTLSSVTTVPPTAQNDLPQEQKALSPELKPEKPSPQEKPEPSPPPPAAPLPPQEAPQPPQPQKTRQPEPSKPSDPQPVEEGIAPLPPKPLKKESPPPKKIPEKRPEEEKPKKKKKKEDDSFLEDIVKDLTPKKNKGPKKDPYKEKPAPDDVLDEITQSVESSRKPSSKGASTQTPRVQGVAGDILSLSEIDAIRSQVAACWNVPSGAMDAENLRIEVRVFMETDGTVKKVDVLSTSRMNDPLFRAAAESAVRALLNPRCNPLKLPINKYQEWKVFTMSFDPKEMF